MNIERVVEQVNSSMSMEGLPLTKADKDRIRSCADSTEKVERAVSELVKKHTVTRESMHGQRL